MGIQGHFFVFEVFNRLFVFLYDEPYSGVTETLGRGKTIKARPALKLVFLYEGNIYFGVWMRKCYLKEAVRSTVLNYYHFFIYVKYIMTNNTSMYQILKLFYCKISFFVVRLKCVTVD